MFLLIKPSTHINIDNDCYYIQTAYDPTRRGGYGMDNADNPLRSLYCVPKEDDTKFFAARVDKKILEKFFVACSIAGRLKQRCVSDALNEWADKIIFEHLRDKSQ